MEQMVPTSLQWTLGVETPTYYNLTGLQQNTIYYIRVVAVNYMTSSGEPLRGNRSDIITGIVIPEPGEGAQ